MWRLSLVASILALDSEEASTTLADSKACDCFCRVHPDTRAPEKREIESFATLRAGQLIEGWMMTSRTWLRAQYRRGEKWHRVLDRWTRRLRLDRDGEIQRLMGKRRLMTLQAELPPPDPA